MKSILLLCPFLAGLLIGLLITDLPFFNVVKDVRIGELGNILLALTVALFIPFAIAPWIDKRRYLKNFLIEELNELLTSVKRIQDKLRLCCESKKIDKSDKVSINLLFIESDHKIDSVKQQFNKIFRRQTADLFSRLNDEYNRYWKTVTGGDLMNENFKINISFIIETNNKFSCFGLLVKEGIHLINNL